MIELKEYTWSFDVSTTNVGIALWDEAGNLVELKHLSLEISKDVCSEDRDMVKGELFKKYVIKSISRIQTEYNAKIANCFIEAPLQNTPKNINTTALLLGFNGIARFILFEALSIFPIKISVHESRFVFCPEFVTIKNRKHTLSFPKGWKNDHKKEYIRLKVEQLEPQIEWFYNTKNKIKNESHDMSDAFCVGMCGLIAIGIRNHDEWNKLNNSILDNLPKFDI